ncbi:hypothetical protein GGR56DRAFT_252573 [Xylariaceae sp. FL0804]|nr:hypothetical protein GGR56DRAFT_252573 [Xylariaceae sp. FL0804]
MTIVGRFSIYPYFRTSHVSFQQQQQQQQQPYLLSSSQSCSMSETLTMAQRHHRQRKFHRRSRNGCSTCKAKHIRCDERRPLCTYCLRRGDQCGYPPDSESSGSSPPEPRLDMVDPLPADPFIGTSLDMPHQSRPLFQLFTKSRVLYTTPIDRSSDSFIVYRALSHPGFLHAALLMTTLHWAWCNGDVEQFRVPYLYHKLQAIRFVNEQLQHPETAAHDGTIAAVASLALVENALGCVDAVSSHLRGLARIKELQSEERRPRTMGLLQRMILMATRCVSSRPVYDMLDISRTDSVHQSMIISLLRVALRPIYSVFLLSSGGDSDEPLSELMAQKEAQHHRHLKAVGSRGGGDDDESSSQGGLGALRLVDSSRSGFLACYFYLYVILREGTIDGFLLSWCLEQLLADVERTEPAMRRGRYSPALWLWTVLFGACAAGAARCCSCPPSSSPFPSYSSSSAAGDAEEAAQMRALRRTYLAKIRLVSRRVLQLRGWEGARAALRLFAWEDGFDGEEELRALWEEAVWQHPDDDDDDEDDDGDYAGSEGYRRPSGQWCADYSAYSRRVSPMMMMGGAVTQVC